MNDDSESQQQILVGWSMSKKPSGLQRTSSGNGVLHWIYSYYTLSDHIRST